MKAFLLFVVLSALAVQGGVAAAQGRLPRSMDPKTCSYNACISECIRTKQPNCDQACLRCPAR